MTNIKSSHNEFSLFRHVVDVVVVSHISSSKQVCPWSQNHRHICRTRRKTKKWFQTKKYFVQEICCTTRYVRWTYVYLPRLLMLMVFIRYIHKPQASHPYWILFSRHACVVKSDRYLYQKKNHFFFHFFCFHSLTGTTTTVETSLVQAPPTGANGGEFVRAFFFLGGGGCRAWWLEVWLMLQAAGWGWMNRVCCRNA